MRYVQDDEVGREVSFAGEFVLIVLAWVAFIVGWWLLLVMFA